MQQQFALDFMNNKQGQGKQKFYQKEPKVKASKCPHINSQHYSKGLCKSCYLQQYYKKKKVEAEPETPANINHDEEGNNSRTLSEKEKNEDEKQKEESIYDEEPTESKKKQKLE